MIINNTMDVIIPAVRPIACDFKYKIVYGENNSGFYLEGNICEEDVIKEMRYFKVLNPDIDIESSFIEFVDFLNNRGYDTGLSLQEEPMVIDLLNA